MGAEQPIGTVGVAVDGAIGRIIFDNPARHNAMSLAMWLETIVALDRLEGDPAVRVILLTGAGGRAFVSGADISRFDDERSERSAVDRYNQATENVFDRLHACAKPTIAVIRGWCIGGGMGIAISCDLRLASSGARFGIPAAKLGLGYKPRGVRRLVALVGAAMAKEIFFTARHLDAAEARAIGLLNRVVGEEELDAEAAQLAATIAANAPLTIASLKATINAWGEDESTRGMARVDAMIDACFASHDYVEGRRAFMEKRQPIFTGG
jgi:enoyl-CoA hydratase/carnithine racemase